MSPGKSAPTGDNSIMPWLRTPDPTPAEKRLLTAVRARQIDPDDLVEVIHRARHDRLVFECEHRRPSMDSKSAARWAATAKRLAAMLIAATSPPFPNEPTPADTPVGWEPETRQ